MIAALLLVALQPADILARPRTFDVIEENTVITEEGEVIFRQWLWWSMQPDGSMACEGWRLVKPCDTYRASGDPRIILWQEGVIVRGRSFLRRTMIGDVEMADRQRFPVSQRRDLR